MRAARPRVQYTHSDQPATLRCWPAVIGAHHASLYSKNCPEWLGVINLYEWFPVYDNIKANMPAYMPRYHSEDTTGGGDFNWLLNDPEQWTTGQSWWDIGPVTGMWAMNVAELRYRNDFARESGPTFVLPGTPVGMFFAHWRDFGKCPGTDGPPEARRDYIVPCFDHYMSPIYEACPE